MKKLFVMFLAFSIIGMSGCSDDDDNGEGNGSVVDPVTNPYKVCAGEVPAGVGIDLDSGTAYDLDAKPDDFTWDIRIKVFKADYVDSPNGENSQEAKGAPHIKLQGTTLKAYIHDGTGETVYTNITSTSVVPGDLVADDVGELDLSGVLKDPNGYPYYKGGSGLNKYYDDNLVIGNDWKLSPDWGIGDEPVYIIETDEGKYVKLMVKGMGAKGSNPGQKFIDVTFELLN